MLFGMFKKRSKMYKWQTKLAWILTMNFWSCMAYTESLFALCSCSLMVWSTLYLYLRESPKNTRDKNILQVLDSAIL